MIGVLDKSNINETSINKDMGIRFYNWDKNKRKWDYGNLYKL